jgi:U4/U6.U5 tri-snRNP-associated protein 1
MQEMEEMARNIQDEDEMEAKLAAMEDGEVEDDASTDAANDVASNMLGVQTGNARGMSGILSMLKATGDLKGKSGGKEELRGRSNDEKTYSDYAEQNLDSVVRLDRNKATDKDMLYTKRQVNLEYRDDHGRLLTRKEAFRQLCYQFHGYGSGKKNQEKRLKKIQMENEAREKRVNEDKGTMGSLRKTQEATGKAFVVHRT